jgi:hypothetical protein
MDIFHINDNQVLLNPDSAVTPQGFLWLDASHDEVSNNPEAWRAEVERLPAFIFTICI